MKKSKDGYQYECRQCASDRHKNIYNSLTPEEKKVRQAKQRKHARQNPEGYYWSRIKYMYQLTQDQFNELLEAQDGTCAICKSGDPQGNGKWSIDHDHSCCSGARSCGKCVRGLLCNGCNHGLGNFLDSVDSLHNAIEYLGGA